MLSIIFICLAVWLVSFASSYRTGLEKTQAQAPPRTKVRPLKNAVDLSGLVPAASSGRPPVPAELEKMLSEAGRTHKLLLLAAEVSEGNRAFLRREAGEVKKRLGALSALERRIKEADSELDIKIAARDMLAIKEIPESISEAFTAAAGQVGESETRLDAVYNDAVAAIGRQDFQNAYRSLFFLGGHKDSRELLERIRPELLSEGQTVLFGNYRLLLSEKKDPIEWVVLKKKGSDCLLVSRFVLDCVPYETRMGSTDWEHCSLRKWLGGAFYESAFSDTEKSMLVSAEIKNAVNPVYGTPGGGDTRDKVFVLSFPEVQEFFRTNASRLCSPTPFAVSRGAFSQQKSGYAYWWLRTPGSGPGTAVFVAPGDGHIRDGRQNRVEGFRRGDCVLTGQSADAENCGVRPAVWLRL